MKNLMLYKKFSCFMIFFFGCSVAANLVFGAGEDHSKLQPVLTALHVHSTFSTGSLSLDEIAERAESLGIDAVVLSENFALRYEYGVPPLRDVFKYVKTFPSLTVDTMDTFLAEVDAVQVRHPQVILIPGVEVAPHYYWTGSLFEGNLTMHNSQRNLLILGLPDAQSYATLPVSGNQQSYTYGGAVLKNLMPVLLLLPAGWMWNTGRKRKGRWGILRVGSLALAVLVVLMLVNAWPFGSPVFSSYNDQLGYRPYQTVIKAVTDQGGVVIWSLPEAVDRNHHTFGPLGTVTIETASHPEALNKTRGYSGFGGLYQDTRHIHEPRGIWDQRLNDYMAGRRSGRLVLFGEIAFHELRHTSKDLDQVLNMIWVKERSRQGIIEAMKQGRLYAVRRTKKGVNLRLDTFELLCADGSCAAQAGDRLAVHADQELSIRVAVSATDQGTYPVSVSLIREGRVQAKITNQTPFNHVFFEKIENSLSPSYYRVEIKGAGEILSNPIFVIPPTPKSPAADRHA